MADVMTFEQRKGAIEGRHRLDRRHQQRADLLVHAAGRLDFELSVATPEELAPPPALIAWAKKQGAKIKLTHRPEEAVEGADCVITDCWVSMGDDDEGTRHNLLRPYQADDRLMQRAEKDAIFMHRLARAARSASRTRSWTARNRLFDEAENRLHAQKGIPLAFGGVAA